MISANVFKQYFIFLIFNGNIAISHQKEVEYTKCSASINFELPNSNYKMFVDVISRFNKNETELEALMTETQINWESARFSVTAGSVCTKGSEIDEHWSDRVKHCESNEKKVCRKTNSPTEYVQNKDCFRHKLTNIYLIGDQSFVNNLVLNDNVSVAMKTTVWLSKSNYYTIIEVESKNFCVLARTLVHLKCDNPTNFEEKRSQQLSHCLKACNYTDGCAISEHTPHKFTISLYVISTISIVVIIVLGIIALGCYIRGIPTHRNEKFNIEGEQYETYNDVMLHETTFEEKEGDYDVILEDSEDYDVIVDYSNNYEVMNENL